MTERAVDFTLMLVTDRLRMPEGRSMLAAIEEALAGGVGVVQLREKDLSDADLLELAREIRAMTRAHGARLLVNGRAGVALAAKADGVHLPADAARSGGIARARGVLGDVSFVGVSTHSLAEITRAEREGADYVTFGPVYATPSKAEFGAPLGVNRLGEACAATRLPVFALGGVTAGRASEVTATGARLAAIAALLFPDDPRSAARAFAGPR